MNVKPIKSAEIDKSDQAEVEGAVREFVRREGRTFHPAESGSETSVDELDKLLRGVSGNSIREIDNLIRDLQMLCDKLHTDGSRVQREIAEYSELSRSVIQMTKIISEGVKKLPAGPHIIG